jgi:hypothetical protein
MGLWSLVYPVESRNMVLNPSAEIAGNFAVLGGATVTREAENQYRGLYSYKIVTTAAADDGIDFITGAATNAIHYVSFRVTAGTAPAVLHVSMDAGATKNHAAVLFTDGTVTHYGVQIQAAQANASVSLHITQEAAAIKTFWIDAIQVESLTIWSTYFDGDEADCIWNGPAHAGMSYRPDHKRDGGYVYDLRTTYGISLQAERGMSSPTKDSIMEPRALIDGMVWQATRASMRAIELTVHINGTTLANFYSLKKAFYKAISRHLVVPMQPVTFWYNGAGKIVTVKAFVESGDEGGVIAGFYERITLTLLAVEDPYWEELLEQTPTTNSSTTLAVEQMVAYRPSQPWNVTTGNWDALGAPELTAGAGQSIRCFAKDKNGNLYVGGDFTNLNGIEDAHYVAMRSAAGVWSALDHGTSGIVTAMAVDATGNLYVGGDFTHALTAGGADVADTHYIAMWNGTAWSALGTGADGVGYVQSLRIGLDGILYIGGTFDAIAGVANTKGIAKWNGAAWSALGTGLTHAGGGTTHVLAMVMEPSTGDIIIGGHFDDAGGVTGTAELARWDVSAGAWIAIGAPDGFIFALAFTPDGRLYAGGQFLHMGTVDVVRVAMWDGVAWCPLSTGANNDVYSLAVTANGHVYAGGFFTTMGGITITDRIAVWNGTSWQALPCDLPGTPYVYALMADGDDIYLGFDTEGNATIYGLNPNGYVVNNGTAPCYPVITIACTVAACTLQEVANATTHQTIRFNKLMLPGEIITIDCRPGRENVRSDFPPWTAQVTLLQPSDLGNFCLLPGNNKVSVYAPGTGATVTIKLRWRIKHEGVEGGAT